MNILSHHLNRLFYRALTRENPESRRAEKIEGFQKKYALTRRECEILQKLFDGTSDNQIATALSISPGTLKKHLQHIYRKLGISARWDLLKFTE